MKDFALQLYSLRDVPSVERRMEIAAEAGYTGVEFAGYDNIVAADMKFLLESLHLHAVGSHIGKDALMNDLDGCVAYAKEVGMASAACPWMDLRTEDDAMQAAAFLETCAERFAAVGIPFAYHNHAHEFEAPNGTYLLELLMKNTRKTSFELDVFWAAYAGVDPVAFIRKHAGRISLLHFKEMAADRTNVELGQGTLDFAAIGRAGKEQGVQAFIVEQEAYTMPPADSVKVDAAYMKALVL